MTSFVREESLPLMDTREGLVVESDDESLEANPSMGRVSEDTDDHPPHDSALEDEEDFHPNS